MKRILALVPLLCLTVLGQDADFRRQVQSTSLTRQLLQKSTAQQIRDLLNVSDIGSELTTKTNLAALAAHTGATNYQVMTVLGASTVGDWGQPKLWYLDTSATTTNQISITNAGGSGCWIHPWDGDASVFVLPSTNDCGALLTTASALAASSGKTLTVTVPGDYYLTTTNGFQYGDNAHIRFGAGVNLIGDYDGMTSGFADPTKAFVRNVNATNWPPHGELTIRTTNVVIEGLRLRAAGTNRQAYGFVAFGVADAQWHGFELGPFHEAWAMNIAASNVISTHHKIRNDESNVYRDGVHVIGGSKQVWQALDVHSGDDMFAISSINSVPCRDIVVQGMVGRSQFGHAVRLNAEHDYNTNLFERITFSGIRGETGISRNGQVRISSASTNVVWPFRDITLRDIKVTGRVTGPPAIGVDYGYYLHGIDGLTVDDCWSGETVYQNLWAINCGRVAISKFTGIGSRGTAFNQTARFTAVHDLSIDSSTFLVSTTTTNTGIPLYVDGAGTVKILGSTFVQQNTGQHAILFDVTPSTNVVIANNTFAITGTGSPAGFATNAVNVVISGNIGDGTNVVSWASGSQPANSVVVGNQGVAGGIGAMNSYLPGKLELAANATDYHLRINRPGIGTADIGLAGNRLTLIPSSTVVTISGSLTASTTKAGTLGIVGYGASDMPLAVVNGTASGSANTVNVGGGTALGQAATTVSFYGAATTNSGSGTELARMFGIVGATDNSTPLYLLHSNTVKRVYATNVGGIQNVLYIP